MFFILSIKVVSAQKAMIGYASFYADKFNGRTTASGAVFRQNKLTAAHRTLPFGTKVVVTNLENNKKIEVLINDRGPFVNNRIIDLSKSAARKLDFIKNGVARVKVEILTTKKYEKEKVDLQNNKEKKSVNKNHKTFNSGYYNADAKKVYPKGFGIQVVSYKEIANLTKRCNEIKSDITKKVLVKVVEINEQKIYRVIIGAFSTRKKAITFNRKLKNKFKGSFVVAF